MIIKFNNDLIRKRIAITDDGLTLEVVSNICILSFYLYTVTQDTHIPIPPEYAPDGVHSSVIVCINGIQSESILCNVAGWSISFTDFTISQSKYGRMVGTIIWPSA